VNTPIPPRAYALFVYRGDPLLLLLRLDVHPTKGERCTSCGRVRNVLSLRPTILEQHNLSPREDPPYWRDSSRHQRYLIELAIRRQMTLWAHDHPHRQEPPLLRVLFRKDRPAVLMPFICEDCHQKAVATETDLTQAVLNAGKHVGDRITAWRATQQDTVLFTVPATPTW